MKQGRAKSIFLNALEVASGEQRRAYVAMQCAGDEGLRREVEQLLEHHDQLGTFLEPSSLGLSDTAIVTAASAVIGPYRLLRPIGEGGMGTVYLAEQEKPVRRQVALKVIRPGMDSQQVIARFEQERQALALMDHPHIAKVLDAGETASGLPYFVMELVAGVPITKYCDEHRLSVRERLELFVSVCQAVQHAHLKGIIHRDLKPSNVLVAQYDGKAVPKVIDFGVAKAAGPKLTEGTLATAVGSIVGTLEYMSPEQAEPNQLDIDTRSDVYALGVLLYELLTGTTPLDRRRLKEVSLLEVLRLIREEEPPRPSLRLSTVEELPAIASNRGLEPRALSGLVRGELDWIVMKCLEKDRTRRYETANGLARELERYLHDEPVEACPPSATYKLRKFARKYRKVLSTAAAFVLMLIAGVVVSIWLAVRATQAESEARQAEGVALEETKKAQGAERDATIAKERAEIEAEIKQAVHTFMDEDLLGQADVEAQVRPDRDVKVRTLLDRASVAVESGRFKKQPEVEAAIRLTIGNAYRATGEYDKARPHLERCLEIRRRVLPAKHPDTLIAINSLAYLYFTQPLPHRARAEVLLKEAVKSSRAALGDEHPITLTALHNAALFYLQLYREAEPLLVKVVDGRRRVLGANHRDTLRSQLTLAQLYHTRGQVDKAQPLYEKTLETSRRALGAEHPRTLLCMNGLATLYMQQGEYARAEPLYLEALEGSRRVLGAGHPNTLMVHNNLIDLYLDQRQYAKAEPLALEGANVMRTLKEDSNAAAQADKKLTRVYEAQGGLNLFNRKKHAESEPVLRLLLDASSPGLKYHTLSLFGEALAGQQKYAEAEPPLLAGYEGLKAVEKTLLTTQRKRPVQALERVVQLYQDWDKPARAAEWRAELIQENRRQARRNDTLARLDRARALISNGKLADAEAAFRALVGSEPDRPEVHRALGEFLCYRKHDHDGAVAALREAVRLQPENPVNHCGLGNALSRKGEPAAAEAAYREALRLRPGLDSDVSREARVIVEETEAREALRLKPNSARAHLGLVSGLLKQDKWPEAEAECREAVRLEPDSVEAHCALGNMLRRYWLFGPATKMVEAEDEFRKALRLKPDSIDALVGLGEALFDQGLLSRPAGLSRPRRSTPGAPTTS